MVLGTPGTPPGPILGTPWGQDCKNHRKVVILAAPRGAKGGHFGAVFDTFTILFWVSFFASIFSCFLDPLGAEKDEFDMVVTSQIDFGPFLKKYRKLLTKRLNFGTFWRPI